jgi:hypothetical protein
MIIGVGAIRGGRPEQIVPGEPRADWCNRCMSSSAVRLRFYVLRWEADPIFVIPVGLAYACMVCNPEHFGMGDGDEPEGDEGVLV